ncbi:MAG: type VI secretion system TssO [Aerococcus sp.]|nr:type VI secretion system TssO [Aerococcus sp.]
MAKHKQPQNSVYDNPVIEETLQTLDKGSPHWNWFYLFLLLLFVVIVIGVVYHFTGKREENRTDEWLQQNQRIEQLEETTESLKSRLESLEDRLNDEK